MGAESPCRARVTVDGWNVTVPTCAQAGSGIGTPLPILPVFGGDNPFINVTGLTGGTPGKLDSVPLHTVLNGACFTFHYSGTADVTYCVVEPPIEPEDIPFLITSVATPSKGLRLSEVRQLGQPCVYNPDTDRWHRQGAEGPEGAVGPTTDPIGFVLA